MDSFVSRYQLDAIKNETKQSATSASLQAEALDKILSQGASEEKLARIFFRTVAKIVDIPWG